MKSELNLVEKLKEYFDKTPGEQIEKDWEATKGWDEVEDEGRTIVETTTDLIPKVVKRIIELQRAGKSFGRKFNIFGDDLTLYKKEYIISKDLFTFNGNSGYLRWTLDDTKSGVFYLKWLYMTVEEIMLKELYGRKHTKETELEIIQEEIRCIDEEIKKYEKKEK